MEYTEKDLSQLVKAVEAEFTEHLAKAEENFNASKLAKSEEEAPAKAEDEKKDEHKEEAKEADPKEESHEESKEEHEEAPKEEHEAASDEKDCDYDDEDLDHMHKMYSSMSKNERKAHHDAIMKCVMSKAEITKEHPGKIPGARDADSTDTAAMEKHGLSSGQIKAKMAKADGCGGEMEAETPGKTPGAKSPASKEQHAMAKTETGKVEPSNPGKTPGAKSPASKAEGVQMAKSEETGSVELLKSELEAEKAKRADLQKNLDAVSQFLTKFVEKVKVPQGKAITSLDTIAKSEGQDEEKTLTKSEVTEILAKKASNPTLSPADRQAINNFYMVDQDIKKINHLLR